MHDLAEFEAWRLHREEAARQIERERLGRRLREARPKAGLLAGLTGRLGDRASGKPQATG